MSELVVPAGCSKLQLLWLMYVSEKESIEIRQGVNAKVGKTFGNFIKLTIL